jgi:hypothetical protein
VDGLARLGSGTLAGRGARVGGGAEGVEGAGRVFQEEGGLGGVHAGAAKQQFCTERESVHLHLQGEHLLHLVQQR